MFISGLAKAEDGPTKTASELYNDDFIFDGIEYDSFS
jgi:hypothetical protein